MHEERNLLGLCRLVGWSWQTSGGPLAGWGGQETLSERGFPLGCLSGQ